MKMKKPQGLKRLRMHSPSWTVVLESSGEKVYWNLHMGGWRKLIETLGGDPELGLSSIVGKHLEVQLVKEGKFWNVIDYRGALPF